MDFDRGLRSIPQIRVARRKVGVEICGIEYSLHISTIQMEVKIISTVQSNSPIQCAGKEIFGGSAEIVNVKGDQGCIFKLEMNLQL